MKKCEQEVAGYCVQAIKYKKYAKVRKCEKCCLECIETCSNICEKALENKQEG